MAATVSIEARYGTSPGTAETVTSLNLLGTDASAETTASSSPIQKPSSGTGYSYERWFRVELENLNGLDHIDNIRVYVDENEPTTGVDIYYGSTTGGYASPKNEVSTVATTIMPESSIPASENLTIGGGTGNTLSAPGYSDYGVIQARLDAATVTVAAGSPTVTVVWDETA